MLYFLHSDFSTLSLHRRLLDTSYCIVVIWFIVSILFSLYLFSFTKYSYFFSLTHAGDVFALYITLSTIIIDYHESGFGFMVVLRLSVNMSRVKSTFLVLWHDDVIKWKILPRCWPFVRGIHRYCIMYSLICAWINGWVNNREAGELRRHGAHYDVTVMRFRIISVANLDYISTKTLLRSLIPDENFNIMAAFAISTASADGLVHLGAGPSIDTVMIRYGLCIKCILPNPSHCVLG